ncbi:hypothetical protein [Microbacterium sp. SA39]|uniref:hypothetical protein n=1 Tax=Microbacterium sp. SA39 TaxID=1263625 RepID=UPI0005F9AE09|nr:hypothetical protein [Microbacterium sp. SA39]KJQ53293.1 hypothetical protein RS85_02807 [Microbacterium sp. SA39]
MRFGLLAGEHARDFVVIGGLNPDYLAPDAPVPHQGTTDIDLLFALGFDELASAPDFAWIDAALSAGGFVSANKWRWDAVLKNARVRLEFLCDVRDHTADTVPLPGSQSAVASKLAGPAAALLDPIVREIPVPAAVREDFTAAPQRLALRFANLGGYLLAKAAAARSRVLAKDKYDLMFVVLFNEGGPAAAARAVSKQLETAVEAADSADIRATMTSYLDSSGSWARTFAQTMIDTGDPSSEEQLRTDASVAAGIFLKEIVSE